jgi:hypothetical protein
MQPLTRGFNTGLGWWYWCSSFNHNEGCKLRWNHCTRLRGIMLWHFWRFVDDADAVMLMVVMVDYCKGVGADQDIEGHDREKLPNSR